MTDRHSPMSIRHDKSYINHLKPEDMRVYQTNEIKNIALLGSAGSGKTSPWSTNMAILCSRPCSM